MQFTPLGISEVQTYFCVLYDVRFLEARAMKRRIIYHAGPTNSGKTHTALERFSAADTGVYCGPLRLLATEVFRRTNDAVRTKFVKLISLRS